MQERSGSVGGENGMLTWKEALVYFLLVQYCVFGLHWINHYAFDGKLSIAGQALTVTLLFLVVYPILAWWKRRSTWVRVGSFRSWLLLGLAAGLLTTIIALTAGVIVRHFAN
jgi:hypothetical protein